VIWQNKIFITTAVPADGKNAGKSGALDFKVLCYDRSNGNLLWERSATVKKPHEGTHQTNGFASASPCTDGERIYAHFGTRGLYCYTLNGDFVWKRDDFPQMVIRNQFGEGSSPTLADDKILVPWDHQGGSHLFALNKLTGKTIWQADRDEPTCWATPLVVDAPGGKQVIMNGQNCARGYDLQTGKEIWRCAGQTQRPVASPVAENGIAYVGSGHQGSFLGAFRLTGHGDIQGTNIASPLLSSGRIYFHKGKESPLTCVDAATGKPYYKATRIEGLKQIYASPVAAGGHVYLTDRSGTTVVINDSNKLEIVATNSLEETVDATPAPVDDELIIRGEQHLFCIAATK
jgi:outer membrane protein assembly factor BamB